MRISDSSKCSQSMANMIKRYIIRRKAQNRDEVAEDVILRFNCEFLDGWWKRYRSGGIECESRKKERILQ
jgi:hypothetical protein